MKKVKLKELLSGVDIVQWNADAEMTVGGVCCDSRAAADGDIFIAVRGYESDGHKYIASAFEKGAVCALCEEKPTCDIPYVLVSDSRRAMAVVSANFFGEPAKKMKMIGVTGTNGKTTVTNLIKSLLERTLGAKVGLIGTNCNMIGSKEFSTERTTPDSFELHKLLAKMAEEKCEYVVMEVSSHSLYLDRVYGIEFDVGLFTNLTEDHLDFHKTMEDYAAAKSLLFGMCKKAVLNLDDEYFELMKSAATGEVFTYSVGNDAADMVAREVKLRTDGVDFCALMTGKLERAKLAIPGKFSVYNALAALSAAVCAGIELENATAALKETSGVKGRAEVVPTARDFTVIIDYAHTPDALENILDTVNAFKTGRSMLIFGCGGDREKEKRSVMGRIAAKKADFTVVTSDNPRTEDPSQIINDILEGSGTPRGKLKVIEDRREAIKWALENAQQGDVVILAGKGHETYQIIGREKHHFDEREIIAEILGE